MGRLAGNPTHRSATSAKLKSRDIGAESMAGRGIGHLALTTVALMALTGCDGAPALFAKKTTTDGEATVASGTTVKLVDRDVEAPDVFQVTDSALWDGRPSLGGVWVASPDAVDPERVILRNPANGKFVIGALFRREAFNPGPKLQISSDAAAALGLLAGEPASISVTALRREEVPVAAPDANAPILDANEGIAAAPLDTAAIASAAIDRAEGKTPGSTAPALRPGPKVPVMSEGTTTAAITAAPASAASIGRIQIGIFSVEANAKRAATTLTKAGLTPTIREDETKGKKYWSVTATGTGDKAVVLQKVKDLGFTDAYYLKG
jgi:hypothetical protein